jgi:TonB-dependent SusC/RagA subfamily outer membrane receptor
MTNSTNVLPRRPAAGWVGALACVLLLSASPSAAAQTGGAVTGLVTDRQTGEPLAGASVRIEELARGAAADVDGRYTIADVPAGAYTLTASFIGFREAEVAVRVGNGETVVQDVALQPDLTGMGEVVVTGIASETSRARAEVAVSSLDVDDLTDKNTYGGLDELVSGKIAGVNLQKTSGSLGSGFRFDVRSGGGLSGNGQPVIYIDGVRVDNADVQGFYAGGQGVSTLANLNPEDIASVEVLKGPAGAALYGTSGSNGVVLITTKTGSRGGAPFSVRYKSVVGVNRQQAYDLQTSPTPELANSYFEPGLINQQSVSISGNVPVVSYYGSFDYRDEAGTLPYNQQTRNNFRGNFSVYPLDGLAATVTAGYSTNDVAIAQGDNNLFGIVSNTTLSNTPYQWADSVAITGIDNVRRINQFIGSADLSYKPAEGLELRASVGYQGDELRNDETITPDLGIATVENGFRGIFGRRNEQYTYDLNARYTYRLGGGLEATTLVGGQAFDRTLNTYTVTKEDFSTSLITNIGAGSEFTFADEEFFNAREAGLFAQQELNYQDRVFLTLGARQDFATAIGDEAASIFYPKASAAVRLDQFGAAPAFADLLKLRVAYGETGQLPDLLDGIPIRYLASPSPYGAGATPASIGNPEIEPERVREVEVGLDADLLGRLGLALTYYYQRASDSIIPFQNAPSTGLTATPVPFNVGEKRGQGVEAEANYTAFASRDYELRLGAIYSYQTNEVLDLAGAQPIFVGQNVVMEGLPANAYFGYRTVAGFDADGVFTGPVPAAVDADGAPAREFLGNPIPTHSGSFSLNLRVLKDVRLYGLVDFTDGLSALSYTRQFQSFYNGIQERNEAGYLLGIGPFADLDDDQLRAENVGYLVGLEPGSLAPGTDAYREAAETYARTNAFVVSGVDPVGNFVEDADYLKLREVSLSYDASALVNRFALGREYVERASLAVTGRNLFTTTEFSGIDPEANWHGARGTQRRAHFATLPPPRTITGTLILEF